MLDATTAVRRFTEKPALLQIISDLQRPEHVSPEDYEAVLFSAPRFGDVVLEGDWWQDEPTPDLLLFVSDMPIEHLRSAVARYVELLFSRTHPIAGSVHPDPKTAMWDVICYLRRRQKICDSLSRLRALSPPENRPIAFSPSDYRTFCAKDLPDLKNALIRRLIALRDIPFSHESCSRDRADVQAILEDEALLQARLFGMLPPWKSHPDLAPDAPEWEYGAAAKDMRRFIAYYGLLSERQRLRLRKHLRENRTWQGWYAHQELELLPVSGEVKDALYAAYRQAPHHLPAHLCKQLADQFRVRNREPSRNLIVFRGGSLVRVFSDVEIAAIREGIKSCIAFRKGEEPITITAQNDGWLCGGCNLYRFICKETLPPWLCKEEREIALGWLAFELLFKDALELHSVLLLVGDRFINLEQKREFSRTRRRAPHSAQEEHDRSEPEQAFGVPSKSEETLPEPPASDLPAESPLTVSGCVSHRIWGEGRLKERRLHSGKAFWTVVFADGEKQLSEDWIVFNCTVLPLS